ncbi:YlbL family protein [Hamadaea tsunoensis]|uniref:YlbL family protein n=1 Tax=Hamadaea tsunoensis TaxID=53368 RepID=UPI00048A43E1|nr:PDZ domain-containing protein [Hamadaea tsunoensis]
MRRRGWTVLMGALLAAFLVYLIGQAPVRYVILGPGPTFNTLGQYDGKSVIQVTGKPTSTSDGQLRMVTVNITDNITLLEAMKAWFDPHEKVVPRELIYPPDQSNQQVEQENKEAFTASQSSAETVALRELGYPVLVTVTDVVADGAAAGKLAKGDVIATVDGTPVTSAQKLQDLVRAKPAGSTLAVGRVRAGATETVQITTKPADDGTPRIGVSVENKQPHDGIDITYHLENVGGPSAGLMFTLGTIDVLKPEDLTGGKVIAGTGTMDDEGNVGVIGGIAQKLVGAKDDKATYFLTPAGNCAEAKANAVAGLTLVKVDTIDSALTALEEIRDGKPTPSC